MIPFLLAMATDSLAPTAAIPPLQSSVLLAQAENPADTSKPASNSFPYASLQVGVGFPYDYTGSFDLEGTSINTSLDLNAGFNGELAVGYQFNRARTELAVGYGGYGVKQQSFDGESISGAGTFDVITVMINGYYDFPVYKRDGLRSRWTPYIGAGIGYANISAPSCRTNDCFAGGSTDGFAYQG